MLIIAILLGWVLGVLINIAADSLPVIRRLNAPRCHACTAPRPLVAWSGLLAWLTQDRDCDYCGTRISLRLPFIELLMGVGSAAIFLNQPSAVLWLRDLITVAIFMLILIIDLEHRLILHKVSIPAAMFFAVLGSLDPSLGISRTIVGGIVGFVFFLLLYLSGVIFARWIGKRRGQDLEEVAFGFGDVMLAMVIGLAVGFPGVFGALLRGILLAGGFSFLYLLVMAARRRYEAYTPIPYGPFLILGALWVYFRGDQVMTSILGF